MTIIHQRHLGMVLANGINGYDGYLAYDYHQLFGPSQFSPEVLGESNWLDPTTLGTQGVEGLTLDNRHIHTSLHNAICDDTYGVYFREVLQVLVSKSRHSTLFTRHLFVLALTQSSSLVLYFCVRNTLLGVPIMAGKFFIACLLPRTCRYQCYKSL